MRKIEIPIYRFKELPEDYQKMIAGRNLFEHLSSKCSNELSELAERIYPGHLGGYVKWTLFHYETRRTENHLTFHIFSTSIYYQFGLQLLLEDFKLTKKYKKFLKKLGNDNKFYLEISILASPGANQSKATVKGSLDGWPQEFLKIYAELKRDIQKGLAECNQRFKREGRKIWKEHDNVERITQKLQRSRTEYFQTGEVVSIDSLFQIERLAEYIPPKYIKKYTIL